MLGQSLGEVDAQQMASVAKQIGGVFGAVVAFVGAAWAGRRAGQKKERDNNADPGVRLAGGVLMDNHSMVQLSERLRENTDALHHHSDHMRELAHQMERLRDKL